LPERPNVRIVRRKEPVTLGSFMFVEQKWICEDGLQEVGP
jgi:hypothetical protein